MAIQMPQSTSQITFRIVLIASPHSWFRAPGTPRVEPIKAPSADSRPLPGEEPDVTRLSFQACALVQLQQGVQAERQPSRQRRDPADPQQDPWHERGTVQRVVPDGQDLTVPAEQHF